MISKPKNTAGLPIKGNLTALRACTVVILVLMIAASMAGVLYSHSVYPADDLRRMFMPNDVVNLCVESLAQLIDTLCLVHAFQTMVHPFWTHRPARTHARRKVASIPIRVFSCSTAHPRL